MASSTPSSVPCVVPRLPALRSRWLAGASLPPRPDHEVEGVLPRVDGLNQGDAIRGHHLAVKAAHPALDARPDSRLRGPSSSGGALSYSVETAVWPIRATSL